eukprot:Nk52_evm23s2340 gene=Nk52_evmTU23s2340
MGDYMHQDQRGGGRGGYYNNRNYNNNRNYYNNNRGGGYNNNYENNNFRGNQRGGGRFKEVHSRIRTDDYDDVKARLQSLIIRIGDKPSSSLERNIEGLAQVLQADLGKYRDIITECLISCSVELSHKVPIYSTLVGLLNSQNYEFGQFLIEKTCALFQESLREGNHIKAKVLLRFLADLVNANVVNPSSLLSLLEIFTAAAIESASINQDRSDAYITIVTGSLAWVGKEMNQQKPQEFNKLISSLDAYITSRKKDKLPALRVWGGDAAGGCQEFEIDMVWSQLRQLAEAGWEDEMVLRCYSSFEDVLSQALHHSLPPIEVPANDGDNDDEKVAYPLPRVCFQLFTRADVKDDSPLPAFDSVSMYFAREHIFNALYFLESNRKECSRQLLNIYNLALLPWDYIVTECLFAEMLRLPQPSFKPVFYYGILIELCRSPEYNVTRAVEQAVYICFEKLGVMDVECVFRLVDWFSCQLSNFNFKWQWEHWREAIENDNSGIRTVFVKESLKKCVRNSYYERINSSLPEDCQEWLNPVKIPAFKFAENELATKLIAALKAKSNADDILVLLGELGESADMTVDEGASNEVDEIVEKKIDIFVTCLLQVGSKSYSHLVNIIERNMKVFSTLIGTSARSKSLVLTAVCDFLKLNNHLMVILLDKLMTYRLIDISTIVNWMFTEEQLNSLTEVYIWEIFHNTLNKMICRTSILKGNLKQFEETCTKREAERGEELSGLEGSEEAESKIEAFNKEREEEQAKVVSMKEQLDAIAREQKEAFLIVFQRLLMTLSEYVVRLDREGKDYSEDIHFKLTSGLLCEAGRKYHREIRSFLGTLETLLFTSEVDPRINATFSKIRSLH